MILLLAILTGLLATFARAWIRGRKIHIPDLRLLWLALAAYLPQWLAFQLPVTRKITPDTLAAIGLVGSLSLLLVFAWINRRQPGFWMLGLGLALNLLVILLNRGFMPIRPEAIRFLAPNAPASAWQVGKRVVFTKNIALTTADTQLWWLSDWFLLPNWLPDRVAFSLGDVLIAIGAFWFLWSLSNAEQHRLGETGD